MGKKGAAAAKSSAAAAAPKAKKKGASQAEWVARQLERLEEQKAVGPAWLEEGRLVGSETGRAQNRGPAHSTHPSSACTHAADPRTILR